MQDVEIYCPYCKVTHTCTLKEKLVYTTFNLIPIRYERKFMSAQRKYDLVKSILLGNLLI